MALAVVIMQWYGVAEGGAGNNRPKNQHVSPSTWASCPRDQQPVSGLEVDVKGSGIPPFVR